MKKKLTILSEAGGNRNLITAKKNKNDEFYTQLQDIAAELTHPEYLEEFKGKWIYCNCDNPEISQFHRFFVLYFKKLGLKRLTCTHLAGTSGSKDPAAYRFDITGDEDGDGEIDDKDIKVTRLEGDGDFRSPECLEILRECDIVITNPPFSLFREYLGVLMEYEKKFAIISSMNSISYKETFEHIKNEQIWIGYTFPKQFLTPDGSLKKFGNIMWWTNIDINKKHKPLLLCRDYYENPEEYPRYDNYDAIEVSKVVNIPRDYDDAMGVPISFLEKFCPEQFEILDARDFTEDEKLKLKSTYLIKDKDGAIRGKATYARILIRKRQQ